MQQVDVTVSLRPAVPFAMSFPLAVRDAVGAQRGGQLVEERQNGDARGRRARPGRFAHQRPIPI